MTKSLLLKGLAGVAAVGGAATGGVVAFNKGWFGGKAVVPEEPKSANVSNLTDKDLIDKAGLDCKLTDDALGTSDTKDCTVKEGSTLRIMVGNQEEEGVSFTTSDSAKLKVSRSEEVGGVDGKTELYNKKLKFVVDSGDLNLTKSGGGTGTNIQKLEQFETYEIFLRDKDKYYLRRRTDAKVGKKNALGLGECELPDEKAKDRPCSFTKPENIKKIRFDGQSEGITVDSGSVSLQVSKIEDTTSFTDGYRFTFTFPQDVNINSKQLKAKIPYEFKIKKGTGNDLTLEQAWSEDKEFAKKAGLKCEGENECTVPADSQNLNVKVGTQKKEGITSVGTETGKIKMEKDKEGYRQGLKFTISGADVSLTGGTATGTDISKLEELETYEITEEGGKYYLTRKTTKEEGIKSSLVLPKECELPTGESPVECTLDDTKFKAINFEGKSSSTGTATLKISKTSSTDFPLGYKFTFNTTSDATIKSDTKIKANIPTDFKIKKNTSTPTTLTLEKAWDDAKFSFAGKVGLTCTAGTNGCCTKSSDSVKLNVKRGNDKKEDISSIGTDTGKIKVEKDKEGYNQGLKFTISGGDVTISNGTNAGGTDITKLEELETYEITEEGGKYYLTRKDEASKTIETQLGLPSSCNLGSTSPCTLTTEDFKKINFDGKDNASGSGTLTISKTSSTDFPLGYKFTFNTTADATITSTNKIKAKIPTEFKIKRPANGGNISLEKAWSDFSFAEKAGLTCSNSNGTDTCCSKSGSSNINVKKGDDKKEGITSINGGSGSGKIKVEKDQEGYNQGLKFTITGGDVTLTGGAETKSSSSSEDFSKLEEYETYEIKESGGKYYLTRKDESIVFIKKQLGIESLCVNKVSWQRTGSGTNASINFLCDISKLADLKKIKIHNGNSHSTWPTQDVKVQLEIKPVNNKSSGGGIDNLTVEISDSSSSDDGKQQSPSTICIPDGAGGGVNIKTDGVNAKYKINKGTGDGSWCLVKEGNGSSTQCTT